VTVITSALEANEVARTSLLESVPEAHVGSALSVTSEETSEEYAVAQHTFECTDPAYPGWYWSVSVIAVAGQDVCTVSEINLLPSGAALVPPAWKPWAERVEAGDLGVGDLLPTLPTDERLTAGLTGIEDEVDDIAPLHPAQWELGLGREQILSPLGLERAVARWFDGQNSARSSMAKQAPANCSSCGFLVAIGGSIGQAFGLCANEFGAADGQIVAMNFGCGAHSSVRPEETSPIPVVDLVVDDVEDEQTDASTLEDYVPTPEPEAVVEVEDMSEQESDLVVVADEEDELVHYFDTVSDVESDSPDSESPNDEDSDPQDSELH
jgi:hypothetical protein